MPTHPNQAIFYWARDLTKKDYEKLVSTGLLEDLMLDIKSYFEGYSLQSGAVFSKIMPTDQMYEIYTLIDIFAQESNVDTLLLSKALCLHGNYLRNIPSEFSDDWWKYAYAGALLIPPEFQFEFVNRKKRLSRIRNLFSHEF